MGDKLTTAFRDRVDATRTERARNRKKVELGRWQDIEPSTDRLSGFIAKQKAAVAPRGPESKVGDTLDFQPATFLSDGASIRRAVGYVECNYGSKSCQGSGFLISNRLFLTNQHVLSDESAAKGAWITFDRELDGHGMPRATTTFLLDPASFALFSPEDKLDYALVALGPRQSGSALVEELGYCILSDAPNKHALGINANIIQHPNGMPKLISIRNNLVLARTDDTLLYETDTDQGASGSPVFNDLWEVIALHHWGEPFLDKVDENGQPYPVTVNEGVRISSIYRDLMARLPSLPAKWQALLKEALEFSKAPVASGPRLGPPRPSANPPREASVQTHTIQESNMGVEEGSGELVVTVPIQIKVSVGSAMTAAAQVAPLQAPRELPVLTRKSEAVRIDEDYSNRTGNGYNETFIPGMSVPHPVLSKALAKQVAPLRATEPNPKAGILEYQHFSLVLNKAKRIAIYTATNIDGKTYLEVDRETGQVKSEGEKWFIDPRVSESFALDQSFYSAWSTYFDRGHLTRRTDPTWGSKEEAERANADTFHFTNCSPQHFRFNQSAKYWQGLERYVLERGVLAADSASRLCVFQGPIFDDTIDRYADEIQIPSSFFKIVVWKGDAGLKAVGLVADQGPLLDEARVNLGAPKDVKKVNINQWRVSIKSIEARTGLDFGKDVRDADTIKSAAQPQVGAEAATLITRLEDIVL